MVVKIDDKKWESAMDLANSENYQTTLDHLESWTETLATFGPESLPRVYGEMVEFLKITPKDLAENKATNPTEVLESLDILSAQCGNARIRTHRTSEGLKLSYWDSFDGSGQLCS